MLTWVNVRRAFITNVSRMPRYYMHLNDGNGSLEDDEGQELAGDDAAHSVAISAARDIIASDVREGRLDLASFVEVEDERHQPLFTIRFADAVRLTGRQ